MRAFRYATRFMLCPYRIPKGMQKYDNLEKQPLKRLATPI